MKLKVLMALIVIAVLSLFAGSLYAAPGDFIVKGNLGVGTTTAPAEKAEINGNLTVDGNLITKGTASINGQLTIGSGGVRFADGTTQSTGSALVTEVTVTATTQSVTISNLSGNAHGGYIVEMWIKNDGASMADIRLYYNNDQVNSNYSYQRTGNMQNAAPTHGMDAIIITGEGVSVNARYYGLLNIGVSPDGYIYTSSQGVFSDTSSFAQNNNIGHFKSASVGNLTQLDIKASVANGIGVGSRFRVWRKL